MSGTATGPIQRLNAAARRVGPIWRRKPRQLFWLSQRRRLPGETIAFRRKGFRWQGFTWDVAITWWLYVHGDYQGEEREALVAWAREQGHLTPQRRLVVEVGANIGTTALPLARDDGMDVLAIEPLARNFAVLRRNVERNGLGGRIRCVQAAVAGGADHPEILVAAGNSGGSELEAPAPGTGPGPAFEVSGRERVRAAPLDALLAESGVDPASVSFVWSDAQGSDGHVITTGSELWRAGVPLFMELWPVGMRRHGLWHLVDDAGSIGFGSFISADSLTGRDDRGTRPIGELRSLAEELPEYSDDPENPDHADVLLIPSAPRPV